jgi:biotin synthase
MGAAWRSPKDRDLDQVCTMVEGVSALGLETCATLGMLTAPQAARLKAAGLDYYNHNLDTSPEFYGEIISTRTYRDRLDTLDHVRAAGIRVCCGGIVGMGEGRHDRIGMIAVLASLQAHPESVPINLLVRVEGTPLASQETLDPFEFVRTIAVARIAMPASVVRLSAGREDMSEETQALCFLAGANSIFYGPKLLTTPNPERRRDLELMDKLGLVPMRCASSFRGALLREPGIHSEYGFRARLRFASAPRNDNLNLASLDDQHRARRKAHQAIRGSADDALIEGRVSHEADHQQVGVERLDATDHGGRGVAGNDLGMEIDIACLGDPARAFEHIVIFVVFGVLDLDDLVDRRRKVGQLLHRNHVQCGAVALGELAAHGERLETALRAIICDHDPGKHVRPPAARRRFSA